MPKYSHIEKHRGGWRATVAFPSGRRSKGPKRETKAEAYKDALRLIAERDRSLRSGSHFTMRNAQDLLLEQLRRRRRRQGTIDAAEAQFRALCELWDPEVELRLLKRESVHWMIDKRLGEDEVSPATVNKQIAHLARLIDIAIREGHMDSNRNVAKLADRPSQRLPERVTISIEKVKDAEHEAEQAGMMREALIIRLLRLTGMRRAEAARIRIRDIRVEDGVLDIPQPKVASQPRQLVLTKALQECLEDLAEGKEDRLFDDPMEITLALRRVSRLVGEPKLRAHAIRHGVGDRVADATFGDVTAVARVLGHAPGSVKMTMRYTQAADERLRAAQRSLE